MGITPMMSQYRAVKEKYSDCMVLFRLGDFYEMFFEDAVEGSKILGIALTARNKGDGMKAPMCGVPFHAVDGYIAKLTRAGRKVALCDQMTEPDGRGIVEREVVRVVTPGTTFDDNILDKKSNNYVACLVQNFDGYGFAYSDVTTGEFFVTQFAGLTPVEAEIQRLHITEIIMDESLIDNEDVRAIFAKFKWLSYFPFAIYSEPEKILADNFGIKFSGIFGLEEKKAAIQASAVLYEYLRETQKTDLKHIDGIRWYMNSDFMDLSDSTFRNLEIFYTLNGSREGSLCSVIDKTETSMGGRMLRKWMIHPLKSINEINKRLEAVAFLSGASSLLMDLRALLSGIFDIERLLARLSIGTGNARDLVALKASLKIIPEIKKLVNEMKGEFFKDISNGLIDVSDLVLLIEKAIKEESPISVREGGMICDGYNPELDDLRKINTDGKSYISEMQKREIERTGISNLKIKYNKVFGYYIEISNSNLKNVPDDYMRKQTLVNAERFITPELKEYEEKVLHSMDRICELEYELFYAVRMKVVEKVLDIKKIAGAIGMLDAINSFAEVALRNNYCKPEFGDDAGVIEIRNGRHPVLEVLSLSRDFVPNDCVIDPTKNILNLITGPNMGGKSVYIKQVALIVYLAHLGCFVPASECKLGLVDQIFTRVGASDNLTKGESTFMIEMIEASNILHNATNRSLVILDEIGRGTSTYDGLSIAWAIVEYLHDKIGAKTLFASHYHELIGLCDKLPRAKNFSVAVSEKPAKHEHEKSDIVFLYKVIEGGTSKSYGIEVAKLAGLPKEVVMKARGVLEKLEKKIIENGERVSENQIDIFSTTTQSNVALEDAKVDREHVEREHKVLSELRDLDPDNLTPLDALKKIHELKEKGLI